MHRSRTLTSVSLAFLLLLCSVAFGQPKVTLTINTTKAKLLDAVNLSFTCVEAGLKAGEQLEYRTKLDAPGDWLGGIKYMLNKWTAWQKGTGANVSYTNFILEGGYTFTVECRNPRTGKVSPTTSKAFQVYWEYPEVRTAGFTIDWRTVNAAKTPKDRYRILAAEYKKNYETWSKKWEYEYNALKASKPEFLTLNADMVVKKLSVELVKQDAKLLAAIAGQGAELALKQLLLVKTIYDIIKMGVTDLILIYRNVQSNTAATMTAFSYAAWQRCDKASR